MSNTAPHVFTTSLGPNGRVVIPAPARKLLGLTEGMSLTLRVSDHTAVLEDPLAAWRKFQDAFREHHWKPGEKMLSEELIEERRAEAERELA